MADVHCAGEELVIRNTNYSLFSSSFIANLSFLFRRSIYSIAKEMGVPKPVVTKACDNWAKYGVVTRKSGGSKQREIPPEILAVITNPETLEQQKFLSLKQRCAIFFDKWGLKISAHGLTNVYRRQGIDYHRSRPQTRQIITQADEQSLLRRQAARDVLNLMASDLPLAFMDETSVQVSSELDRFLISAKFESVIRNQKIFSV